MDFSKIKGCVYAYFKEHGITNRAELRKCLSSNPIEGVPSKVIESMLSEYKKEQKARQQYLDNKPCNIVVCVNDIHIPWHDKKVCDLVFECAKNIGCTELVLAGDILDCYQLSSFIKDPGVNSYTQDECDIFYEMFSKFRKANPYTKISYILGNHEYRIQREQWQHTGFYGIRGLEWRQLLRLDELGIDLYIKDYKIGDFTFTHGTKSSQHSSFSAKAESMSHGNTSGMSGHCHRKGEYNITVDGVTESWYENGCLCRLDPEYVKGVCNWQHGFSVIYFKDGFHHVVPVLIQDRKFIFNGVLYA